MAMEKARMQRYELILPLTEAIEKTRRMFYSESVMDMAAKNDARKIHDLIASSIGMTGVRKAQWMTDSLELPGAVRVLDKLNQFAGSLKDVHYHLNSDGSVRGSNANYAINEIGNIVDSYLASTASSEKISIEITLDNLLQDAVKKHPLIAKFLVYFLLPVLITILTNKYFPEPVNFNRNTFEKNIKREVRKIQVDNYFLNNYRFVTNKSLDVWSSNSTKSKKMARLYFGQLVRVVRKKKNWALIEYQDKNGEVIITGWVFTRYVKKFK
jgi:hypothetical protein